MRPFCHHACLAVYLSPIAFFPVSESNLSGNTLLAQARLKTWIAYKVELPVERYFAAVAEQKWYTGPCAKLPCMAIMLLMWSFGQFERYRDLDDSEADNESGISLSGRNNVFHITRTAA